MRRSARRGGRLCFIYLGSARTRLWCWKRCSIPAWRIRVVWLLPAASKSSLKSSKNTPTCSKRSQVHHGTCLDIPIIKLILEKIIQLTFKQHVHLNTNVRYLNTLGERLPPRSFLPKLLKPPLGPAKNGLRLPESPLKNLVKRQGKANLQRIIILPKRHPILTPPNLQRQDLRSLRTLHHQKPFLL